MREKGPPPPKRGRKKCIARSIKESSNKVSRKSLSQRGNTKGGGGGRGRIGKRNKSDFPEQMTQGRGKYIFHPVYGEKKDKETIPGGGHEG